MPLLPSAPYDTLATVTALTRTILADYIANLNPAPQGTCSVTGTAVTWLSGPKFSIYFNGAPFVINGIPYQVLAVTSATTLTLTSAAVTANPVPWVATIVTGDLFGDNQAYVVPTVNLAWRKLQKKLDYASHPRMRNWATIFSLPAITNLDPASQQYISWTGFFDGTNLQTSPTLPQDFLSPLSLTERQSVGVNVVNNASFAPMTQATDGLRSYAKGSYNRWWDWREDAIYFIGSILPMDIQVQYQAFLPDIVPAATFAQTIVPIMRCAEALANYTAGFFVDARGGVLTDKFNAAGDDATDALTNRQGKLLQRGNFRRRAVYDSAGQYRRNRR